MNDPLLAPRVQENLKTLVDTAGDAIVSADASGTILLFNKAAERMFGASACEMTGKPITSLMPNRFHASHQAGFQRYLMTGESRVLGKTQEFVGKRKDGSEFPLELTLASWKANGQTCFTAVIRDITERKKVEDRLKRAQERSRALIDQVKDYAILMLDPEGRVLTWNSGAEIINGYRADEVLGKSMAVFYPPEAIAEGRPHTLLEAAEAKGFVHDEGWRIRKDGTGFWADVTITALHDERGMLTGFAKITRDSSRRRKAEEADRKHSADLARVNQELETFSYSVSHDLRAPLRAIEGFSKILEEKAIAKLDGQERALFERIRASTQRMTDLIDDLLLLSRVTRSELHLEEVDLSALAREIAEELRKSTPDRQVEIVIAPKLSVRADPGLLRVALENLIGNAWKFTARHPRARIEVGAHPLDGALAYFVRDDGAGFSMEYAGRLFGPFQRLHSPGEFEGTGIGLATVQRIIHRHGGRVWAESEVEKGATFHFTLSP